MTWFVSQVTVCYESTGRAGREEVLLASSMTRCALACWHRRLRPSPTSPNFFYSMFVVMLASLFCSPRCTADREEEISADANDVEVNDVAANDVDANDVDANNDVNANENIGGAGVHHIVDINNIPVVIEGNNETLDSVLRNVIEIKELCRRIDERLNTMENRNNVNVNHNNIDMLPQLPMNNIEEIDNFEIILASAEAQSQLINMLVMIGGTTTKDAMKRALQKLFTNNLASKCSWTGAKNNFKLKELKIIICMKASIKKTCPSITEAEFEDILKTWFRQANLRLLRENARKNVINNT